MVLNHVHGLDSAGDAAVLPVRREHCDDLDAARELFAADYFVMDVQLHHVDTETYPAQGLCLLRFLEPSLSCAERFQNLAQMNFIKEVFLDSETAVGVISGVPDGFPLPVETMAATRDLVNELAGSRRCVSQAMIDPTGTVGDPSLHVSGLEYQVKELGAVALKCYTGRHTWYLDDEEVSYPMLEEATRLGIRSVNVHKGLPAIVGPMAEQYVRATDLPKVARDWPRLNFVAYHSGYFGPNFMVEGENVGGMTGIDEFLDVVRGMRGRRNIYAEIGSAFAITFLQSPVSAAHLVGSLLRDLGSSRIVWGTDSIWWGSPQWQIDAFKMLEIPATLQATYGYPPLTEHDKRRILGLNAARLYRIPVRETRCQISSDQFAQLRQDRETVEQNRSLRTYGPRTRREFLRLQELEHGGATGE
jgi:hypothetical protein